MAVGYEYKHGPRDGERVADLDAAEAATPPVGGHYALDAGFVTDSAGFVRTVALWCPDGGGHRNPPYCKLAEHPGCPAYGMAGA